MGAQRESQRKFVIGRDLDWEEEEEEGEKSGYG